MHKKFIEKIDPEYLDNLISESVHRLYISLPNIHQELADALIKAKSRIDDIRIVIDIAESSFRNGYGNVDAIEKLRNHPIDILVCPKNRVSFIICDDDGFFLFPESRIFSYEDIGNNAVKMDPLTQLHLIEYFFSSNTEDLDNKQASTQRTIRQTTEKYSKFFKETLEDIEKPESPIDIAPLDSTQFEAVKKEINTDPPVHPDLQRQIQMYSSKIQFLELTFEGANLHVKKINIPPEALPFKDKEIKKALEAKMRLFDNLEENENFKDFFNLKNKVDELRKRYCVPVTSRKKNIIFVSNKEAFKKEFEDLKEKVKTLNRSIPQHLDAEILKAKKRIKTELITFLKNNPPDEIKNYQLDLFHDKVDDVVSRIINRIAYPDPKKIVDKISLKENFYVPTVEDFRDQDFLKELEEREIMNRGEIEDIVSYTKAFEAKKAK